MPCAQLQLGHDKHLLAVECDDVNSLIQLTLHTDTVLAAIEPAVRPWLQGGQLQAVRVRQVPAMTSSYGVVWQRWAQPFAHGAVAGAAGWRAGGTGMKSDPQARPLRVAASCLWTAWG
jgi:hypothetical protein